MFRKISLKTIKKLRQQGLKSEWHQDGANNMDHAEMATEPLKADLTVDNHQRSAVDVTKTVLQKMKSEDLEQKLSDRSAAEGELEEQKSLTPKPLMGPAPNPQPSTCWEHGVNERRKTIGSEREYADKLTIDADTVHRNLEVSDDSRKVTSVREEQPFPDQPQRFDVYLQLLCSPGQTGCCYWEFDWTGWVEVSVSYAEIGRKGSSDDCRFGFNAQSWVLECSGPDCGPEQGFSVRHDSRRTRLAHRSVSGTAAVFVDCPAGTVSFYEVSPDALTPLHTFSTTFTGPLYPGFGLLSPGSSVSLQPREEINK